MYTFIPPYIFESYANFSNLKLNFELKINFQLLETVSLSSQPSQFILWKRFTQFLKNVWSKFCISNKKQNICSDFHAICTHYKMNLFFGLIITPPFITIYFWGGGVGKLHCNMTQCGLVAVPMKKSSSLQTLYLRYRTIDQFDIIFNSKWGREVEDEHDILSNNMGQIWLCVTH